MQTEEKRNVLVIVGREAEPPIVVDALRPRSAGTAFTLLVPAVPRGGAGRSRSAPEAEWGPVGEGSDWLDALVRAEQAAAALRAAGLEVVETIVGEADLAAAAGDVMHAREIDDVVVLVDPEAARGVRPDLVAV